MGEYDKYFNKDLHKDLNKDEENTFTITHFCIRLHRCICATV